MATTGSCTAKSLACPQRREQLPKGTSSLSVCGRCNDAAESENLDKLMERVSRVDKSNNRRCTTTKEVKVKLIRVLLLLWSSQQQRAILLLYIGTVAIIP